MKKLITIILLFAFVFNITFPTAVAANTPLVNEEITAGTTGFIEDDSNTILESERESLQSERMCPICMQLLKYAVGFVVSWIAGRGLDAALDNFTLRDSFPNRAVFADPYEEFVAYKEVA